MCLFHTRTHPRPTSTTVCVYSKRFASCSSDRSIKVWDLLEEPAAQQSKQENDGPGPPKSKSRWACSEIAKPHTGSIWRLSWAHPEFGQVRSLTSYMYSCCDIGSVCQLQCVLYGDCDLALSCGINFIVFVVGIDICVLQ
jgi:WD40 repeat protein